MWKKPDSTESSEATDASKTPFPAPNTPKPGSPTSQGAASATLGRSVVIKGELTGAEDLTIEGHVDGTIDSRKHSVVIGQQAVVKARIVAKHVVVLGKVEGDITASTKIEIRPKGSVEGDLVSPAVAIAEGAMFRGSIDMSQESVESAA